MTNRTIRALLFAAAVTLPASAGHSQSAGPMPATEAAFVEHFAPYSSLPAEPEAAGKVVDLTMTEQMTFEPRTRIGFTHEPLTSGIVAGAEGHYVLEPDGEGTRLTIDLTVSARLPLPAVARPAVHTAMSQVLRHMGGRFASNMLRELDHRRSRS